MQVWRFALYTRLVSISFRRLRAQCLILVFNNRLASCQSFPATADFLQDHRSVSPPLVSLRLEVPLGKISPDGIDLLVGASKIARKDQVLAKITEESFDQIEPRSAGRREVEMKAGMNGQPSHHLGGVWVA